MAYEKQTWQNGDTVTAEKLNHMEDGIAAGGASVLLVGLIQDEQTGDLSLDKTWQEIHDAAPLVWLVMNGMYMPLRGVAVIGEPEAYLVGFLGTSGAMQYAAQSADGYPIESGPSSGGNGEASGDTPIGEIGTNPKL